jgi:pyruvate formate lyase activating enzyme
MEIKGLIETSFVDWPGRVCSVVFLGGCNFRCPFCHNHELVISPGTLVGKPPEEVINRLKSFGDWLDGVVISGGEPCLDPGLPCLCRDFVSAGLPVKIDTNGSFPGVIEALLRENLAEAVSMDLKAPLDDHLLHHKLAGVSADLEAIHHSIDLLLSSEIETEFRTTVISGLLNEEHLQRMAQRVKGADRYKINPFRPLTCLDKAFEELPALTDQDQAKYQEVVDSQV